MVTDGVTLDIKLIVTAFDVTEEVLKQDALLVMLTVIAFPATRMFVEYVADVSPVISIPLFCH